MTDGRLLAERESGSAVAGFLLVSLLVTVMFLGLVQVAVIVHVRSVLIDCAGEGARRASRADRDLADGEQRTRELIAASLSDAYTSDVTASYLTDGDLNLVQVEVSAPIPVIGLWGPGGVVTVTGHALREEP